jgi:hypothetical protein
MSRLDTRLKRLETKRGLAMQAVIDKDNPAGWTAVNGLGDREIDRVKAWVFDRNITLLPDEEALWLVPPDVLVDLRDRVANDPGTARWMAWLEKRYVDEIVELEDALASGNTQTMEHALTKRPLLSLVGAGDAERALREKIDSLKRSIESGYQCSKDSFPELMREHVAIQKARHGIVERRRP